MHEDIFPSLPTHEEFLRSTDVNGIKALQHRSDALRAFAGGFDHIPLAQSAAERLVEIGDMLKTEGWDKAHDNAQDALRMAMKLARTSTDAEIAKNAVHLENLFKSGAPRAASLKSINHPEIQAALEPLKSYLETFGGFLSRWAGLAPKRILPQDGEEGITPSQHRSSRLYASASPVPPRPPKEIPPSQKPHAHLNWLPHDDCTHPAYNHSSGGQGHSHGHSHSSKVGWIFGGIAGAVIGSFIYSLVTEKKNPDEEEIAKEADSHALKLAREPAAKREADKTALDRTEDIGYTVNHSLACLTSDFVTNPVIGALTQQWLGRMRGAPASHNHGIFGHTVVGEITGDLAAVPPTIFMQRYFPSFMNAIRRMLEPVLGRLFHAGAERMARHWAKEHHLSVESQEYKDHVEAVYQNEVSHLPQALMWTASSTTINIISQKLHGNKNPVWQIAAGAAGGIAATAAIVVGGRAIAPEVARKWDRFTSRTFLMPVTRTVGRLFGVQEKPDEGVSWAERMDSKKKEEEISR